MYDQHQVPLFDAKKVKVRNQPCKKVAHFTSYWNLRSEVGITFPNKLQCKMQHLLTNKVPIEFRVRDQFIWSAAMNFVKSQVKNCLFISSKNEDEIGEFVKLGASLIKERKIVLLFTRKHVDFMSILAGLNKEQMQNLIISYHSDLMGIIDKLLELHDWAILPDLVILNLNSYFDVAEVVPPFKMVCFCISALLSYMRSVDERQSCVNQRDVALYKPRSVSLLNGHPDVQIQLLIDFYFYKMSAFSELDAIKYEILN